MSPGGAQPWTVIGAARRRRECEEQGLVLEALGIPWLMADGPGGTTLLMVQSADEARARAELRQYLAENRQRPSLPALTLQGEGSPGVVAYVLLLVAAFLTQARFAWGVDWLSAGTLDGGAVRSGEWWRLVTALTLHADAGHLVANLLFGAFFGLFAGQYLGSGVAWATILLAAGAGNALDLWLLPSSHRAIGASTAVFAALGLVAALMWRAESRRTTGWARRYAPLIGASVLLAYIGTGDARTDAVAHLTGFVMGIFAGAAFDLTRPGWLRAPAVQRAAGLGALALVAACWWLAVGDWRAGLAGPR